MQIPVVGQVFEGLELQGELGEGGFGAVFLAADPAGRRVALKVVKPDENGQYSRSMRARFEREVRVLAGLRSPYIVALLTHGAAADGLLYMVFEYVPGRDLTEYLKAVGRLEPKWVEHIMRQVLLALDEAHKAGLIHRDLKPDNIRIFETQHDPMTVKLLDFGIARATDHGHPSITKTGELIGTPRYMSPEQLKAQPLGPPSDIYSLGMVAIELLVGEAALPGSSLADQFGRLISSDNFLAPELVQRAGPLLGVFERMTALEPHDRFPSAAAVIAALDRPPPVATATPPIHARPHSPGASASGSQSFATREAPPTSLGTNQLLALLAGLVVLVLVFAGVVLSNLHAPTQDEPPPSTRANVGILVDEPEQPQRKPDVEPEAPPTVVDAGGVAGEPADAASSVPAYAVREGAFKSPGCGKSADTGFSVTSEGHARHVPSQYDPKIPLPLVILARMDRQPPADLLRTSDFGALADREGVVVFAPEDQRRDWYKVWRDSGDADDVEVLVDDLGEELCLDRARVYVVAVGEGERLAMRLVCEDWVTAVAVTSSIPAVTDKFFERCDPRPIPVLWLSPANSDQVPIDGSVPCDSTKRRPLVPLTELEQVWVEEKRCKNSAHEQTDDRGMTCRTWSCQEGLFRSCEHPGGMGWSGTTANFSTLPFCKERPAASYPGAAEAWTFFDAAPPLTRN